MAPGIVRVQIHQDEGLPRPQRDPALERGQHDGGADEDGQEVIRPVTRSAVGMAVAAVAWEQPIEGGQQIGF